MRRHEFLGMLFRVGECYLKENGLHLSVEKIFNKFLKKFYGTYRTSVLIY